MMDPAAAFFFTVLALQAAFTGAVVLLVGRRFPARLPVYRFVVPAALPLVLLVLLLVGYAGANRSAGVAFGDIHWLPLGRFVLAYAVLWLVGVLFASLLLRLMRRR
ncbi:hypothetical protein [Sphingomonas morindae]|uniref:Integral membrane protein n=1 Tax=Sphingomonas morindae TaxID=1541170 RepID=A0ABY4X850_9SPHN|nr:hypothetical protein [Sphingomonas morindae]USI73075.1 hypothetical protein LHA26_00930 [Sphingomonas morindae]